MEPAFRSSSCFSTEEANRSTECYPSTTAYFQARLQYCVPAGFLHPWINLLLAREENKECPPGNENRWESLPPTHAASLHVSHQKAALKLWSFHSLNLRLRHSPDAFSIGLQQPQRLEFRSTVSSGARSGHAVLLLALVTLSATAGKRSTCGAGCVSVVCGLFQLHSQNLLVLPLSLYTCH